MKENGDRQAVIAALLEDAPPSGHPDLDALVDYQAGALDPAREAEVQDHLVVCRACAEQLLGLATLGRPEPSVGEGVADLRKAASWKEIEARLAAERATSRRSATSPLLRVAAAVFFLTSVALGLWNVQLRRDLDRWKRPQGNLPIVYLDFSTRAQDGAASTLALASGDAYFLLFVTPNDTSFDEYELVLSTPDGEAVLKERGLRLSENLALRQLVPASLPSGEYRVHLLGLTGEERTPLDEYPLTLRHPP